MSLPREWSYLQDSCRSVDRGGPTSATTSQEIVNGDNFVYGLSTTSNNTAIIDENMNQSNQLGSLFSIHSAPVFDVNGVCCGGGGASILLSSPTRPASLVVQTTATSTPIVPPHLQSPPDTIEDDDNDNLLTISSLTARPLIAKSRELRTSKNYGNRNKKPRRRNNNNNNNDERDKRGKNVNFVPLDGGYGWIVVCGAFFVQFWVAGLVKSYGVLYVEVMETFRDSSAAVASWIPAILSFFCLALAPVTSMLCQKYSCRVVVFIGGLFCALGLTISFFATSLIHLFFTFGVLTGIGGGLSTTPGIIIVSQYFDKHRALANGICVSGTAAGSFVFPLLIETLVANFGFHGTILLLGGCMLHVCVSATLYRPLEDNPAVINEPNEKIEDSKAAEVAAEVLQQQQLPTKQQRLELLFANDATTRHNLLNELFHQNSVVAVELTDSEEEKDIMGEGLRMKPISKIRSSSILHSVEDLSTDSTCVYKARASVRSLRSSAATVVCPAVPREPIMPDEESIKVSRRTMSQKIARYIDLTLLKDPQFIMMCLSVSLMSTGSPYMLYYLPAYVHAAGYTKSEAGYLVAISAALDLCGRLGLGWLSDLQLFDRRKGYIGSIVGAGVAVLAIPMAHSFYVLACSVGMYGLCLGCWFLLVPVLLADQYGTDKISSSYGLVRMFQSVGAISIPPLAVAVLADSRHKVTKKLQEETKKKASFSKPSESEKRPIWHHEWTLPKLLSTNENFGIHEIVQGPFASPRLVKASPCVIRCPKGCKDADSRCYKIPGIRRGIPDPWNEYLALRGFCNEYDRKIAKRHLRLGCDSVRLTEAVWNDLGLTLTQGIPDPWKDCPYDINNLIKKKTSHSRRKKSRIKLRGSSRDPIDSLEPLQNFENKMATEMNEKMTTCGINDTKSLEKGKKVRSENPQTVFFDPITENSSKHLGHKRIGKKRAKSCRDEQNRCRVINVRHCYQPNRLSCEINRQPRKSRLSKEKSLEKKNEAFSGRSRVLEENVTNRVVKVRHNEEKLSYPCRVCQPDVTPTRCSRAVRMEQENFWRCTRHQPGSSYRLEASQVCRRKKLTRDNGESLMTVEPEMNSAPFNSKNDSNENAVAGLMNRFIRNWTKKNGDKEDNKLLWDFDNDGIHPEMNFVCCRCSCPYLRAANLPDYDYDNLENGPRTQLCKKCNCSKCLSKKEQKIKERNTKSCPKHGKKAKNKSKAETDHFGGHERAQEDSHSKSSKISNKQSPEAQTVLKEDEGGEKHFLEESVDKIAEGESELSMGIRHYRIEEFPMYVSSDSGNHADSEASRQKSIPVEVASVTSSTFIRLMREKANNEMGLNKNYNVRENTRILVASSPPRRDGRRGKRHYVIKRSNDDNFRSCRCDDERENSEFNRIEHSIVEEQKHVTYEAESSPRIENKTIESPEENYKRDEELSSSQITKMNKDSIEENEDRKEVENLSKNSDKESCHSDIGVSNIKENLPATVENLNLENAISDRSNIQTAVRKKRITKVTAEGISSVKLPPLRQHTNSRIKKSASAKIHSNVKPEVMSGSTSSRRFESRETDMIGVKLLPGPCIRERCVITSYFQTTEQPNSETELSENPRGNRDWNDDKKKLSDPSYEMVEPFEKVISNENADTDDPEIEFFEIQDKIASKKKQNRRQDETVSGRENTARTGFFENGKNDAKKVCTESKSSKIRSHEELIVQSYSESDEFEKKN